MSNLTEKRAASKPAKPYDDFPLFPHATRRWAKKVRGKLHYFGPWDDPDGAINKWLDQKDDLLAGREPRSAPDGLIVHELVNRFLDAKRHLVDTRELSPRTWADYKVVCERVANVFGTRRLVMDLAADDFERLRKDFAKTRGPVSLANDITRVRVLFKWAYDSGLIDRPVRYGPTFKKPSATVLRRERQKKGERMFEAAELRRIVAKAGVPLKAMILLGINCGFGNNDVATLPLSALKLKQGWLDYPRPKTAVARQCPLWPETVKAIEAALAERPKPRHPEAEDKVFVTQRGLSWAKAREVTQVEVGEGEDKTVIDKVVADNPVAKEMRKLLDSLGLKRAGLSFYALRHTFETVGGGSRDQVAVNAIMGHAPATSDMSAVYREHIVASRLIAVTDHVRTWLLTEGRGPKERKPKGGWKML
jgi:integrase